MSESARDPVRDFHPSNREAGYAELRKQGPAYWSPFYSAWIVSGYDDVNAILRHPNALALDATTYLESFRQRANLDLSGLIAFSSSISLLTRPPRHEAVRRILAQALAGTRRLNLPEALERRAALLLDEGERAGSLDLVSGYAKALALFVIGSFLGIAEGDFAKLSRLAFEVSRIFERSAPSVKTLLRLNQSAAELIGYFAGQIAFKRQNPGDDGISLMAQLAGQQLGSSDEELAGYCTFFFLAAEETTAAAISEGALILLRRPQLRAQLASNPSRIPQAARELLRLVSPVQYIGREMRVDFRVGDQLIRAGESIILMLGAANRDPAVFPDPDEPRLDRSGPESLVFATGPYRCIGAQLATFEVEVAMSKLVERPQIRLMPDPPVWTDRTNIVPLERLPVYFES
jgi:pimeloyl-[acyl-carrier protein] synthase